MSINVAITRRCNETCPHCHVDAGPKDPSELSVDEWFDVLSEVKEFGFHHVHVFGGEPFASPHLRAFCEQANRLELSYNVATNGTLVDDGDLTWLRATGGSLVVSVHGLSAYHDKFSGHLGSFKRVRELFPKLVAMGVDADVSTCLTRGNVGQYLEVVELFAKLGARAFFALHFSPIGRGANLLEQSIPPPQWYKLYGVLRSELPAIRRRLRRDLPVLFELATFPSDDKAALHHATEVTPCTLPHHPPLVIDWAGRVYPCMLLMNDPNWQLGNVRQDPLDEVVGELTRDWLAERVRRNRCRDDCPYYYVCEGGCFAYSRGLDRDYRCEADGRYVPFCPLRPVRL
ncbi:MAG: radical SAM protein [Promethearchaeota archaeon]